MPLIEGIELQFGFDAMSVDDLDEDESESEEDAEKSLKRSIIWLACIWFDMAAFSELGKPVISAIFGRLAEDDK